MGVCGVIGRTVVLIIVVMPILQDVSCALVMLYSSLVILLDLMGVVVVEVIVLLSVALHREKLQIVGPIIFVRREVLRDVRRRYGFTVVAIVVLADQHRYLIVSRMSV